MDSRKPQHRRFSLVAASVAIVLVAAAAAFLALGRADPAPAAAPPPALAPSALPYLPSKTLVLTSKDLEADAHIQSLSSELSSTGFVVGFQRTFQGPSKHRLELVQSRTLRFATAAGAARFAAFVGKHAGDYVGQIPTVRPLTSDGRTGSQIVAPMCACHMSEPTLLGVVSKGRNVTWLEINGPAAGKQALADLLRQAP